MNLLEQYNFTHQLPIDLEHFGYVQREFVHGHKRLNRCMRDFVYYALHYYHPEIYGPNKVDNKDLEDYHLLGSSVPAWFMWTGLQLKNTPKRLAGHGLELLINHSPVRRYGAVLRSFFFPGRMSAREAIKMIEDTIKDDHVAGVDIGYSFGGIINHVIFAWAYDDDYFYLIDTHHAKDFPYEKLTPPDDPRYIMRIAKKEIPRTWSCLGRVWRVLPLERSVP